jgi:hypothetical protein
MVEVQTLQAASATTTYNKSVSGQYATDKSGAILHIIMLAGCIAILVGARIFDVNEDGLYLFGFKWPMQCAMYETFGVKCSLCGVSRSLCFLAHGSFRESVRFHALGTAIFAFVCLQIPYRVHRLAFHVPKVDAILSRVNLGVGIALAVAVFINWLIYLGGLVL